MLLQLLHLLLELSDLLVLVRVGAVGLGLGLLGRAGRVLVDVGLSGITLNQTTLDDNTGSAYVRLGSRLAVLLAVGLRLGGLLGRSLRRGLLGLWLRVLLIVAGHHHLLVGALGLLGRRSVLQYRSITS